MNFKVSGPHYPIINDGTARYRVVTDDDQETTVATHMFLSGDHKHPRYEEYMKDQRLVADTMCAMFNLYKNTAGKIAEHLREIDSEFLQTKKK